MLAKENDEFESVSLELIFGEALNKELNDLWADTSLQVL